MNDPQGKENHESAGPPEAFDLISAYSRQEAIEDGVLIDMTEGWRGELLRAMGSRLHTAMTATAYAAVIGDESSLPDGQHPTNRWLHVLSEMKDAINHACRANPDQCVDTVSFKVQVWNGKTHETVSMYVHGGPGDDATPVQTIMLEGED